MTIVAVGDARSLSIRVDATAVERVISRAPSVAYFWLRNYLGQVFGRHRQHFLRLHSSRFGRGSGLKGQGLRVAPVNEGRVPPAPNEISYRVTPAEPRFQNPIAAAGALKQLVAEAYTGNDILPLHEFGARIVRRARRLAVPIKTRPGTPQKWRAANPNKRLVALPSKRDDSILLYEAQKVRRRGRPPKNAPPPQERLRLRFVLRRQITLQPTLHLYDSWDQLSGFRDQLWARTAQRMQGDLERGVDS